MESIHRLVARLLQATRRELDERHDEEELPNAVLVKSLTSVTIERITRYEEAHIGIETVVTTRQTLWATTLRLLYAGGAWTISKTETAAVF